MPAAIRSLESIVLQAHRAKGVRYPTAAQKDCFKTWYSYALRQGEVERTKPKVIQEHRKHLREIREAAPGGRTYLSGAMAVRGSGYCHDFAGRNRM
ncbi:hypothetical protein CC86DRAFT_465657 [Ophiobolus disseminans]|uniref:Uncharacterized protein n=1 Tax=Ophiobolus disseminans TaxID=1469910 RepID=A0A6A7A4W3_9PLEO|nr:hypothetical protein CC86DRAFT_465657 [Ophiobolus disseminans]